ncbi:hypothetical protein POM88_030187 [Heracleum sosnowskyi]|uniref:Uncharacterized protein n=1 Tax=Heracleum sosnowskyi TaxID=360622 RepID=A0AAD8HWA6_9APIA|nr:hypothetical protein POM88_030187 [Heracleum sosnowskyi]
MFSSAWLVIRSSYTNAECTWAALAFSPSSSHESDKRPSTIGKVTSLSPNAVEFVPSSLRSSPANTSAVDVSSISPPTSNIPLRKAGLNRSESSVSNRSDEEARQYWSCQLPDDIISDFNVVGEDDSTGIDHLPFSDLSMLMKEQGCLVLQLAVT